jgi:creatinine amidohydrolase
MLLQFSTWYDIDAYLQRSRGIIIPTGSTEQHGPNGLIGTDALCAEAIAQGVGARYDVLIAPTLSLGVAQFNLGFPGTLSLRSSTLMSVVTDIVQALVSQGFQRIYFVNGHGGNIAPLRAAFQDIYQPYSLRNEPAPVRCRLRSWWEYPQTDVLRQRYFGDREGMHATPSEVAITQYTYPDSIRTAQMAETTRLSAGFLRDHGGDNHYDAATHRRRFADGRVGSEPALATPVIGGELLETAIAEAYQDYCRFLQED